MKQIYLDRGQCKLLEIPYMGSRGPITVPVKTLLESKDYDKEHRNFLAPLLGHLLKITKPEENSPGWYTVVAQVRGFTTGRAPRIGVVKMSDIAKGSWGSAMDAFHLSQKEGVCKHCPDRAEIVQEGEEVLLISRCIHCDQPLEYLVLAEDWVAVEEEVKDERPKAPEDSETPG